MKNLLFLLLATTMLFTSCQKKDSEPGTRELLIKKWKITSATINNLYSDYYNGSTLHFKKDGRFSEFSVPRNTAYNGDYTLTNNKDITLVYDAGGTGRMTIERIEKSVLQLSLEQTVDGVFYRMVLTLE